MLFQGLLILASSLSTWYTKLLQMQLILSTLMNQMKNSSLWQTTPKKQLEQ